jgi:hypothetical protein
MPGPASPTPAAGCTSGTDGTPSISRRPSTASARALALRPDLAESRTARGYALSLSGRNAEAEQEFLAAVRTQSRPVRGPLLPRPRLPGAGPAGRRRAASFERARGHASRGLPEPGAAGPHPGGPGSARAGPPGGAGRHPGGYSSPGAEPRRRAGRVHDRPRAREPGRDRAGPRLPGPRAPGRSGGRRRPLQRGLRLCEGGRVDDAFTTLGRAIDRAVTNRQWIEKRPRLGALPRGSALPRPARPPAARIRRVRALFLAFALLLGAYSSAASAPIPAATHPLEAFPLFDVPPARRPLPRHAEARPRLPAEPRPRPPAAHLPVERGPAHHRRALRRLGSPEGRAARPQPRALPHGLRPGLAGDGRRSSSARAPCPSRAAAARAAGTRGARRRPGYLSAVPGGVLRSRGGAQGRLGPLQHAPQDPGRD